MKQWLLVMITLDGYNCRLVIFYVKLEFLQTGFDLLQLHVIVVLVSIIQSFPNFFLYSIPANKIAHIGSDNRISRDSRCHI